MNSLIHCLPESNLPTQMWNEMKKIREKYYIAFIKGDSAHLGDPVHRRRIYIVMVRRLVMLGVSVYVRLCGLAGSL